MQPTTTTYTQGLQLKYLIFICTCAKDFPGGSDGKASAYNVGDPGSIPGLGRSPGEGNGNSLQYPWTGKSLGLGNPMDSRAW